MIRQVFYISDSFIECLKPNRTMHVTIIIIVVTTNNPTIAI